MPIPDFKVYPPKGVQLGDAHFEQLSRDAYVQLYRDFKRDMLAANRKEGERSFHQALESPISDKPIQLQFVWKTDTSAIVIWVRPGPVEPERLPDLAGLTVLLTRLEPEAEREMVEKLATNPNLTAVDPAAFDEVKNGQHPVAATFFTKEESARDSLIRALITMSAAAFFDQFGMADPQHVVRIKFEGLIAVPEGSGPLDMMELMIPQAEQQALFREFNNAIKAGQGFVITMNVTGDQRPLTIRFSHVGKTAAFFMMSYDVNEDPKHIHGLTALLPKLDRAEDRLAINHVRQYAVLRGIKKETFDHALEVDHPVAATFFAEIGSANYPPLHNVIKILSAAFFGQLGIGSEGE
jgi:hypothetical protein